MKNAFLAYLLIIVACGLKAQGGNETQGARANALGGASVTLQDGWAANNNVASLGLLNRFYVAAGYESRYFLREVGLGSVSMAAPLAGGTIGIIGHNYGYAGFNQNRIGLGYGRQLSEFFSLGAQVDYLQTQMGDVYGSRGAVVGEVGILITPNEHIVLGAHVFNPTRTSFANFNDERIPTSLRIGGQYTFSDKVMAIAELDKDIDLPLNVKSGLEYHPVEAVFIRAGFATAQQNVSIGLGFLWNELSADVSANWNQNLGYSSAISLGYAFGKRNSKE
ncbi:MAG: hypothetical protein Salg2KO_19290 [Salibacteraceae bacterium]